jgi:uroporphyrin-III C-methyltransferase
MTPGKVYLVGAGPGDPGLLTIKARDLIAAAGSVIYDHLVNPELLYHASTDAELIYAGKQCGKCVLGQEAINALLVTKANEHSIVVRLKGGDPFVFGRGGEEAEALVAAGIEWEVVPGVSSGVAAAAYAGIPLTHRGVSSSVAFVTGHEDLSRQDSTTDWERLATAVDTLVIFMGVGRVAGIAERLIAHGRRADAPIAVVRWGTCEQQETVVSTLLEVARGSARIQPPGIIVVGEVVRLREHLQWFEGYRIGEIGDPRSSIRQGELLASGGITTRGVTAGVEVR